MATIPPVGFTPPTLPTAPTSLQAAQDLINGGAQFSLGAKLPDLPLLPGGLLGIGVTIPTLPFSLCGYKLPGPLPLFIGFEIPTIDIPLPEFLLALGISCANLLPPGNPVDFAAGIGWGGGRVGTFDHDPDDPGEDE